MPARAFRISRGALREVIGRREGCGLVVRRPNLGRRVITLSGGRLLEIFYIGSGCAAGAVPGAFAEHTPIVETIAQCDAEMAKCC